MLPFFLKNRISIFMAVAGLAITGIISIYKIPLSLMPPVKSPTLSVITEYPGIDPKGIERTITKPMERIIKTVPGIEEIYSSSEEGRSRINLNFSPKSDMKISALKLREKIELIGDRLPREARPPMVMGYDPSQRPIVIASINMEGQSLEDIREFTEQKVKPLMERIEGVSEVNISGGRIGEIHLEVDRNKVMARELSIPEIASSIRKGNISQPGGMVRDNSVKGMVQVQGRFQSLHDIERIGIFRDDGLPVRIKELGTLSNSYREKDELSRQNGKERVSLYIHCAGGANILKASKSVVNALKGIPEINVDIFYNQGEYIESAVDNALLSGVWGMVVVFLVILFFFHTPQSILPIVLSIPASIIIVPFFLHLGNRGFNLMSLSGLALAGGMVVDNGVVIVHAISKINRKKKDLSSVINAVLEVKGSIISSTATTIAVFLPLMLFSKTAGDRYGDLAYTITSALLISLAISIFFVPALYISIERIRERKGSKKTQGKLKEGVKRKSMGGIFLKVRELSEKLNSALEKKYNSLLTLLMAREIRVLVTAGLSLVLAMVLSTFVKSDRSFDQNQREFNLYLEFPTGTSLKRTEEGVKEVENLINKDKRIGSMSSRVEKWKGTVTIKLKKKFISQREEVKHELKEVSQGVVKKYGGFTYTSETMAGTQKEVTVHLWGDDGNILKKRARFVAREVGGIEGVEECLLRFREGKPEYSLVIDRIKAGLWGLSSREISEHVRSSLFGPVVTKLIRDGREVDLRLRYIAEQRNNIDELLAGRIKNRGGNMVPLRELIRVRENKSRSKIYRLNGRKCHSVTARSSHLSFQELTYRINKIMDSMAFPKHYGWEFDSSVKRIKDQRHSLIFSVLMSVILIYMILASLFESLSLPLLIMMTIPLSMVGVVFVLFLSSSNFTPSVYLGLIVLFGIVVNNGIIFMDIINRRITDLNLSKGNHRAIIEESAKSRFNPIVITTATTVLGLLPMLIANGEGSSLWRPFAMTVVSGLLCSTMLTLIVLPIVADIFYRKKLKKLKNNNYVGGNSCLKFAD